MSFITQWRREFRSTVRTLPLLRKSYVWTLSSNLIYTQHYDRILCFSHFKNDNAFGISFVSVSLLERFHIARIKYHVRITSTLSRATSAISHVFKCSTLAPEKRAVQKRLNTETGLTGSRGTLSLSIFIIVDAASV